MAVPNLNHVGVWHVRGPGYNVYLILVGDEKRGFVITYAVIYPERKDMRSIRLPDGATMQQAVDRTDETFAQLKSGKTPLGGPWGRRRSSLSMVHASSYLRHCAQRAST